MRGIAVLLGLSVLAGCQRPAPPASSPSTFTIPDHMFANRQQGDPAHPGATQTASPTANEAMPPRGWWSGSAWEEHPPLSQEEIKQRRDRLLSGLPIAPPSDRVIATMHLRFAEDGKRVLEAILRIRPPRRDARSAPDVLIWFDQGVEPGPGGEYVFRNGRLALDRGLFPDSPSPVPGDSRARRVQDIDVAKVPLYDVQRKRFATPELVCQLVEGQMRGRLYEAGSGAARSSQKSHPCLAVPNRTPAAAAPDFLSYERKIFAQVKPEP